MIKVNVKQTLVSFFGDRERDLEFFRLGLRDVDLQ